MKKRLLITVMIAAAAAAALALTQLARIAFSKQHAVSLFDDLRKRYTQTADAADLPPQDEATGKAAYVNEGLLALREQNPDCIGWLTVDGTSIDYPVMFREDSPEFYLDHDFYGKTDYHGVPFVDSDASSDAGNIIIYGHNNRDGSMFAPLERFADAAFCEEGHEICFETLQGAWRFEMISVFRIPADDVRGFPYHLMTDFSADGITAADFFARTKYYALWYGDVSPGAEDKLLTLSTCEYTLDNGRLVVVAIRID